MLKSVKKTGLAVFVLIIMAAAVNAQDISSKELRRAERRAKKEQRSQALQESRANLEKLVQDRSLFLEASTIYGKYSQRWNVDPNNFILIQGDRMVLQTSSLQGIGYNGLGGVTLEGRITNYKTDNSNGKGPIYLTAQVSTFGLGNGTLIMSIGDDGNASATFTDSWGNRITFLGKVVNPEGSTMFQGMRLI